MYDNVYYDPKRFDLEIVADIELAEPDYSFDMLVIWKGKDGFYLGTDSGCSCPTPFEDYKAVEDLTGPLTAEQAREEAQALWDTSYYRYQPVEFAKALSRVV